jgi:hypothetical protein
MIIKENTVCYTSQKGHKGFWYPSENKLLIMADCRAEQISWVGGSNKMPIKVLKSCLMPLDISDSTTKNISPPTKDEYTVVWIERCFKN